MYRKHNQHLTGSSRQVFLLLKSVGEIPPAKEVSLQEAKAKIPFPIRQPVVPLTNTVH